VRKLLTTTGTTAASTKPRRAPNLANADDIADYLLRRTNTPGSEGSTAGYDSMSETDASEAESDTNAVELPEDYVGRGNKKGERKAVRLVETGPRLELRLIKVVEGLVGSKKGEGETVFHEFGMFTSSIVCRVVDVECSGVLTILSPQDQERRGRPRSFARSQASSQSRSSSRTSRQCRPEKGGG
jgi:hypothetical protein